MFLLCTKRSRFAMRAGARLLISIPVVALLLHRSSLLSVLAQKKKNPPLFLICFLLISTNRHRWETNSLFMLRLSFSGM